MSRTIIVGWIMSVVGLLGIVGIDLPADVIESLLNSISGDAIELYTIVSGALIIFLRKITDSAVAKGLAGWFGVKE